MDETKLDWLGRFKVSELERAYTRYYTAQHGTRSAVAFQKGLILATMAAFALYVGIHALCKPCADVVVLVCLCVVFFVATLHLALRFLLRQPVPLVQEITVVLCGIAFGVASPLSFYLCDLGSSSSSLSSSSSGIELYEYLPPATLLGVLNSLCVFSFLIFGCVTWPRSLIAGFLSWALELAGFISVVLSDPTLVPTFTVLVGAIVYVFFSAAISSREHRHDYAAKLKLERALGAATAQKEATKSIVCALFPTGIADRLIEARYLPSATYEAGLQLESMAANAIPFSIAASPSVHPADVEMGVLRPSSSKSQSSEFVVDSFASASVVCVSFDGLESIKPADAQLEVLSQLFIAAERIATTHGAVKIKSIGTALLFVCGTTKSDGAHTENACRLAVDLQRMLAGFQKERSIACISLRGSVAMGPVAAGVIGIARPKYDVWGFTVSVAEKLCQVAGQGSVLVTRDVAKAEQSHFKFHAIKQLALVQGIGKILPFMLVPAANLEPIFANCTPAEFSLPKPKVLALSDVAKTMRKRRVPKMNPITLRFPDKGTEALFLPVHIAKFLPHLRWISLVIVLLYLYSYVSVCLLPGGFCTATLHANNNITYSCLVLLFLLTWTPLSKKKPKAFLSIIAITLVVFIAEVALLLDLAFWQDPSLSGLLAAVVLLSGIKIPSWVTLIYVFVLHLGTFFILWFLVGYKLDSLLLGLAWTVITFVGQRDWEMTIRSNFVLNTALVQSEEKTHKEKDAAQGLLESVVPLQVLQKMESVDLRTRASFLSEFIPASTTLTCTVVGFDALYRKMEPVEIVKLLNALFSHFDTLAQARGVVPLKTIADEYIVVGNMLREMETDHAERVVGLAVDMVNTLAEFNANLNPTKTPVLLRIGIHSSSVLSGVIRTKSFVFDCWGAGVPVAEQIMFAAAPNVVLVSSSTMELLGKSFAAVPLGNLPLMGATGAAGTVIQVFGVTGNADRSKSDATDVVDVISCDMDETPTTATSKSQPQQQPQHQLGGVDYGVFTGSTDFTAATPSPLQMPSSSAAVPSSPPMVLDPQFVPVEDPQPIEAADAGLHFIPVSEEEHGTCAP